MFVSRLLSTKLGKVLAITALVGAASLHNPGIAEAQNVAAGQIIPHMLEVPDQSDQVRGFETLRGTKGLVMLFSRSLAWWPTCIHQAVVWNENIEKIRSLGLEVVSVTADDVATVQRFAKIRKIDFALLSDENRGVINAFGLFNDRFPEGSRYRGTAIPMVVVVNAKGVVTHTYSGHGYTEDHEIATIVNNAIEEADGPKS